MDLRAADPASAPPVPLVELRYSDLTMDIPLSAVTEDLKNIPTVGSALKNMALAPVRFAAGIAGRLGGGAKPAAPPALSVLSGCSGVLRPGTLTLLIAPPGHGKSTFLKALTNILPPGKVKGTVHYNGVEASQVAALGVRLGSLCQCASCPPPPSPLSLPRLPLHAPCAHPLLPPLRPLRNTTTHTHTHPGRRGPD